MKKQTWLARVAVASLVFGMAGAGSLQAAEDYTLDDGTTKTISDQEVKTLRVTNGSGLTATNVTVTGGAYSMGDDSLIGFKNSHVSGESLYAGPTSETESPLEIAEVSIEDGTVSVKTLRAFHSDIAAADATVEAKQVELESYAGLFFAGGSLKADALSLSESSQLRLYNGTNVTIGDMTIQDGTFEMESGSLAMGSIALSGESNASIEGSGTLNADYALLEGESQLSLGAPSGDSMRMVTKKLTLRGDSGIELLDGASYEMQGEENVVSGNAMLTIRDGSTFSMAEGAALHVEADENRKVKNVVDAAENANVDVSKGTLYISNAKTDGNPYDISTAIMRTETTPLGNFAEVYGSSRRAVGTKIGEWQYTFASNISEITKDSAIPNVLTAADSSSGAFTDFIDKAFGDGMTDAEGHNEVEHAASMAGMLGVAHGTYSFAEDMSALIADHAGKERGIWATYVHQDRGVDGFSAIGRKAKYDMKYNGILLGGDFRTKENARTGFAFMYADGSHTEKDGVSGKADTKYYGLDFYHHFQAGGVSYKADIGYIKGDYDLEQTQLGTTNKGDVGGNAFFAGIRAEKDFACGTGTVTPYAGLRYYRVHTGDFTDSLGLKHETGTANVWSLPLGVEFRHETKNGAWTVSPVAELGYRFILGGKDVNETVYFGTAADRYSTDVAQNSFLARLGIEAESPVWSLGGGYRYQKGSDSRANEWYLQVGYRF